MQLSPIAASQHTTPLDGLQFHPTCPLLATRDVLTAAGHVWTWLGGALRLLATVGDPSRRRHRLDWPTPLLSWHPTEPWLAVSAGDGVRLLRCDPTGEPAWHDPEGPPDDPPRAHYQSLTFDAGGQGLWASSGEFTDWLELPSLSASTFQSRWHGLTAAHPEGLLTAGVDAEQGQTVIAFFRPSPDPEWERIQLFRRALTLDMDGYHGLAFSSRGDRLLVRGNSYGQFVWLFEFPSLRLLHMIPCTSLGPAASLRPSPVFGARDQIDAESLVLGPDGDSLLLGLNTGHLAELDLATRELKGIWDCFRGPILDLSVRHHDGLLAMTDATGALRLHQLSPPFARAETTERVLTRDFLAATAPAVPYPTWGDLDLTDGVRDWDEEAMRVPELPEDAPSWARMAHTFRRLREG